MSEQENRSSLRAIAGLSGMALARLVSPLLTFIIIVMVARIWGEEQLGKYNTIWVWFVIFRSLSLFGIGELISREIGADRSKVNLYQSHGLAFTLAASLISAAAMTGGSYFFDYDSEVRYGIIIISCVLPLHACTAIFQSVLMAFRRNGTVAASWVLENVLFISLGSFVIMKRYGLINLLLCLVVSRLLTTFLNAILVRRTVGPLRLTFSRDFALGMLPGLIMFGVSSVAYYIFMRVDVVMLSRMTDMATVGLYSSASNLMEVCVLLPMIFFAVHLPLMAEGYRRSAAEMFEKIERDAGHLFVLVFLIFGLGILFSDMILPLIYGRSFTGAGWIFRLMMLAFLILSADGILALSCFAAGHNRFVMTVAIGRAIINIALNLVCIPLLGALGAALTTVMSILFSFIAFELFVRRNLQGLRWGRILGRPALACALTVMVLVPFTYRGNSFLQIFIFIAGYALSLFVMSRSLQVKVAAGN